MGTGYLLIELFVADYAMPVGNVRVLVKNTEGAVLHELTADENGHVDKIALEAPTEYGDPYKRAFSIYDVEVPAANGFMREIIHDCQIFDGITSILPIQLQPAIAGGTPEENTVEIYIPLEHGTDMDRDTPEGFGSAEIMRIQALPGNEVQIPEYITVHLGSPNAEASNVRVPFKDYIKNVASSEIFPTWEESALYANIYSQISFALNRVFTVMR